MTGSRLISSLESNRPLGLFGGRFDPVHRAHIAIAQAVADKLNLDEVHWIVTGDPAHKPAAASADDRLQMTRLALHELADPRMVVDDREIIVAKNGGSNYTADTVVSLQQDYPGRKLIWILGEDQLQNFLTWSRWQWLIHQVDLAVCARPGAEGSQALKTITEAGGKIHLVCSEPNTVSSTAVRNAIQAGILEPDLIPVSVAAYIAAKFLYR